MPSMLLKPPCLESSRGSRRLGRAVLWVMSHPFWNGIYSMLGFGSHALIDGPIVPSKRSFQWTLDSNWMTHSFAPNLDDLIKGALDLLFLYIR